MKHTVACTHCGKRLRIVVSQPGDLRCRCPHCGEAFPVHISRALFAAAQDAERSDAAHEGRSSASRPSTRHANRRLLLFFLCSAGFVALVVGALCLCGFVLRSMHG